MAGVTSNKLMRAAPFVAKIECNSISDCLPVLRDIPPRITAMGLPKVQDILPSA